MTTNRRHSSLSETRRITGRLPVTLVFSRGHLQVGSARKSCVSDQALFPLAGVASRFQRDQPPSSTEAAEYTTLIGPVKGRRWNFLASRKAAKKGPATGPSDVLRACG